MKKQDAIMTKRQAGKPKRFKIRYIFLGLLLVLGVWFAVFRIGAYRDLKNRLVELAEAGYPLTMEELGAAYAIDPARDNAVDYYLAAFPQYSEMDDEAKETLPWVGRAKRPARTEPVDPALRQAIETFLAENEKALSLLHEAAALDYARFSRDFSLGHDMPLPSLLDIRHGARLLALESLTACANDDPNRAAETVRATLALARSLDDPVPISRLVQIAVRGTAYSNLEQVVNRVSLTDAQLQTLSGWVQTYVDPEGYRHTLIGERCFGLAMFRDPGAVSPESGGSKLVAAIVIPMKILGLYDRDMLAYVDMMQDYIDALALPEGECMAAYKTISGAFQRGERGGFLTRQFAPASLRTYQLEMRHLARRRVTLTVLAIERHRLAQGGLPNALGDLVPTYLAAVPIDPFDGQPLRYRLLEKGYVIYSIDTDEIDDGGVERNKKNRRPDGKPMQDANFFVEH